MSTLKVAAINNPSASSGGLAISASGNVTGAGLDLITTQSFSAVSSVSINNCFSGDYDNYRVLVQAVGSTASATPLQIRLRVSGSDSAASYSDAIVYGNSGGGPSQEISGLSQMPIGYIANATTSYSVSTAEIMGPFGSQATSFAILGGGFGTTTTAYMTGVGFHGIASSYTGLTLFPATGTITGFVSVFGYKK